MRLHILTLGIMMILCGCQQSNQDSPPALQQSNVALGTNSIGPVKIDGMRTFSFNFDTDSSGHFLKTIDVYSKSKMIQTIIANKEIEPNMFQLIDCNFDGFKDIFVCYNCGSGGCTYWIWNYSEQENSYVYNEKLSDVLGLEIDTIHQFVVIHNRSGWDQERWDSLKYVDNKLTFIKGLQIERWIDVNGNSWTKQTREEMVDNKLFSTVDNSMSK